jgi:predicted nucleic acid binding AN1-type Zn finger protein
MTTKCASCLKKVLIPFTCRCQQTFCATHRHAELHKCSYDYAFEQRVRLISTNPVVTAPKLDKI